MTDMGVTGLWADMNEPANFMAEHAWTVPPEMLAHGEGTPTTMAEAHNVYGSEMSRSLRDGLAAALPGQRPFVLTRAGFAGVQRHAAVNDKFAQKLERQRAAVVLQQHDAL